MNTTKYILIGILSLALFSCENDPTKETSEPIEDKEPTDVSDVVEKPDNVVDPGPVYGIDISKYQGDEMDILTKENDSLQFIISKSTEGVTYTDSNFQSNWKLSKEKGFIRGAYHFYRSDDSPEQQAENFMNAISDLELTDLPPIIDFEESSIAKGADKEKVIEDLWQFIFLLEKKSGRKPIIYTDVNVGNAYLTASRFTNYTLWIANYTSAEKPTMPGAWEGTDWILWQKSSSYTFKSYQNDFDVFNGNLDDLKKLILESKMD